MCPYTADGAALHLGVPHSGSLVKGAAVCGHLQLRAEARNLVLPVRQHRSRHHYQVAPLLALLHRQVRDQRNHLRATQCAPSAIGYPRIGARYHYTAALTHLLRLCCHGGYAATVAIDAYLDRLAEPHVISEDAIQAKIVQTQQPAQAMHLIIVQVHAGQATWLTIQLCRNVAGELVPCACTLSQRRCWLVAATCNNASTPQKSSNTCLLLPRASIASTSQNADNVDTAIPLGRMPADSITRRAHLPLAHQGGHHAGAGAT